MDWPRSRLMPVVAILAVFAASALLPLAWVEGVPACLFRLMTNFDCPGCGLTRAFVCLFHGEFARAMRFNAMAPVIVLWLMIYLAEYGYSWVKEGRPAWFTSSGGRWISRSFLVLLLSQWLFKTVPHLTLLIK